MSVFKTNFLTKLLFLIMLFFLTFPVTVFAGPEGEIPEDAEEFSDFKDLDGMHIEMDASSGHVYIPEVKAVQEDGDINKAFNFAYGRFQSVIVGFSGVCTLTFVLIFLVTFVNIGASSSNPQKKAELSKALVWIGLGAAGFGAVTLILGLAFGLFRKTNIT